MKRRQRGDERKRGREREGGRTREREGGREIPVSMTGNTSLHSYDIQIDQNSLKNVTFIPLTSQYQCQQFAVT